jgi:hypothetical protein
VRRRSTKNYYSLVKKEKFGEYELIIRQGTSGYKVRNQLISEGFRVFRSMTAKEVRKAKSYNNYGEYVLDGRRETMSFPNGAFEFIQNIQLLPEDLTTTIVKQYNRSIRKWEAFLQDDNKNQLSEIEQRQTKEEINALTESDFTLINGGCQMSTKK